MPEQNNPSQADNGPPKLRTMGVGELLDTVFSLYRAHFWSFFGIASGYFIAMAILISIFFLDDSVGGSVRAAIWVLIIIVVFGISLFVVSRLVLAGAQVYLGRTVSVRDALRQEGSTIFAILRRFIFICSPHNFLRSPHKLRLRVSHRNLY